MLDLEIHYWPHDRKPRRWREFEFHHDDAKLNLLWLVHPLVDEVWDTDWDGDAVSHAINTEMDINTRPLLALPPADFVKKWMTLDKVDYLMTQHWPPSWPGTMKARALEVQHRLFPRFNVVPFRKAQREVAIHD